MAQSVTYIHLHVVFIYHTAWKGYWNNAKLNAQAPRMEITSSHPRLKTLFSHIALI
jgi:hypothetical protein